MVSTSQNSVRPTKVSVGELEKDLRRGEYPSDFWAVVQDSLETEDVVRLLNALMQQLLALTGEDPTPQWWSGFVGCAVGILSHQGCLKARCDSMSLALSVLHQYILFVPQKRWKLSPTVRKSVLEYYDGLLEEFESNCDKVLFDEITGVCTLCKDLLSSCPERDQVCKISNLRKRENRRAAFGEKFWPGCVPVATLLTVCPKAPEEWWESLAVDCIHFLKDCMTNRDDENARRLASQAVCAVVGGQLHTNVGWIVMDFLEWRVELRKYLLDTHFLRDVNDIRKEDVTELKRKLQQLFDRTYRGPDADEAYLLSRAISK